MPRNASLPLALLLALFSGPMFAQSAMERAAPAEPLDAYQAGVRADRWSDDATLWKALSEATPDDPELQLNWYRSERNARLQRNNGQLSTGDARELARIKGNLERIAPEGYQTELARYYEAFPSADAFTALERANKARPASPDLIAPNLNMAHTRGDKAAMDRWTTAMEGPGQLAESWQSAGADLLLSVEHQGILFTNGDLDTHPVLVRQRRHGQRRDVLVVDRRLLADNLYRQRIWKESGASGPVPPATAAFPGLLAKATTRPVHLAMGLDPDWIAALGQRLTASGVAFVVDREVPLSTLDQRWQQMAKPWTVPPLSNNYVVAGAILLRGLQAGGDEARRGQVELELRAGAKRTGTLNDLYRAGVLQH